MGSALLRPRLDRAYLESEDFFDLFWRTWEKALRTSQKEKVSLYVRVLLRSTQGPSYRETAQEYLEVLAEMTMPEVRVAAALYELQRGVEFEAEGALKKPGQTSNAAELQPQLPDMSEAQIDTCLKRLERTGLVRELVGSYFDYTGGAFRVTQHFRNMMVYLALNDLARGAA